MSDMLHLPEVVAVFLRCRAVIVHLLCESAIHSCFVTPTTLPGLVWCHTPENYQKKGLNKLLIIS